MPWRRSALKHTFASAVLSSATNKFEATSSELTAAMEFSISASPFTKVLESAFAVRAASAGLASGLYLPTLVGVEVVVVVVILGRFFAPSRGQVRQLKDCILDGRLVLVDVNVRRKRNR